MAAVSGPADSVAVGDGAVARAGGARARGGGGRVSRSSVKADSRLVVNSDRGTVEVTSDGLDGQHVVRGWWSLSPSITVGPVVPQPETSRAGHVLGDGVDEDAVNVEVDLARKPIGTVLVESSGCIRRSRDREGGGRLAKGSLLVGQVHLRVVDRQEGNISLLGVARVEGETYGSN